jgi:hypothetical protein
VRFANPQRELETLTLHVTLRADRFGLFFARVSLFASLRERRWEEQGRLRAATRRVKVPGFVKDA